MEAATKTNRQVTNHELHEAEQGLIRLLHAKHSPREWIERHVPEVMAQARTDFAARLAAGREDDTVNLLVVIAYRHAMKVLRANKARPRTTSIETVFHLADESTPTPEQEAVDHDRQARLVKAMGRLPERDRTLLALVYFEEMSVREAGRRLGWGKSSADRHHQAALDRLRALVGERSLLGVEIGVPAFVAARQGFSPRAVLMWLEGAAETIREVAALGGGRFGPLAETGNAAAISGAGRTAAGVCGAAVVACLAAATGVVGPGVGALSPGAGSGEEKSAPAMRAREVAAPLGADARPPVPGPQTPSPEGSSRAKEPATEGAHVAALARHKRQAARSTSAAPPATVKQTVDEFGVEGGEAESGG